MKKIILTCLLASNFVFATEKKVETTELCPLTVFKSFEVMTVFSAYDKVDQKVVHDSLVDSFKKIGKIDASEKESMLQDIVETGSAFPICYFSIQKGEEHLEVSFDVVVEVEVVNNKYKTTTSIWKDTLYFGLPKEKKQEDVAIASLTKEIVKKFADDWKKANQSGAQEPFFRVRTFKEF